MLHGKDCTQEMCTCLSQLDADGRASHMTGAYLHEKLCLRYEALDWVPWTYCMIGTCGVCGKQLCIGSKQTKEALHNRLDDIYTYAYALQALFFGKAEANEDFGRQFIELFHEEDRQRVSEWTKTVKPPCYQPNDGVYPLCKGHGNRCADCQLWEDWSPDDPYGVER